MDNNVIEIQTSSPFGTAWDDPNANWTSISKSGSNWVEISSNASTEVSGWRAIKQARGNTSSAINLFKIDDKIITVAQGTKIVYVEYMGNGMGASDRGITTGLVATTTAPTDLDHINYISEGNHSYTFWENGVSTDYYYGVTKIGGGDPYSGPTQYGGIDAYSVHGSVNDSTYNPKLHMAMYTNTGDNRYIQSAYHIASSASGDGWTKSEIHGYTFAACTGNYNGTGDEWYNFTYSCNKGYKYTFEITTHGLNGWYDGVVVFEDTKSSDPDTSDELKQLVQNHGAKYYVCYATSGADDNGSITGSGTYTYDATNLSSNNETITIVFRKIGKNNGQGLRYASIKVTRFINVKVSGNDGTIGGEYNIPLQMAPYKPYPDVLDSRLVKPVVSRNSTTGVNWSSVSGFYESNIVSSPNYSKLVITNLGKFADGITEAEYNKFLATDSSDISLYLHWKDAYDTGTFVGDPVSTYCTSEPMISNTTSNKISLTITDSDHKGVKFASGLVDDYYCNLPSGFKIDSDNNGTYLTVPSGLPAGEYNLNPVTFSSPVNDSTYEGVSVTKNLPVINVSSVEISSIVPNKPVITQSSIIPAYSITLDKNNLSNYFSVIASQTITYNNDASSITAVSYSWGGSVYIPSKGKITETTSSGFTFNGNECYVELLQSKSYISTTASREKNVVEGVFIYDSNYNNTSILHVNELINFNISAQYTSGEIRDLTNDGDDGPETGVFYSVIYPSLYFSML